VCFGGSGCWFGWVVGGEEGGGRVGPGRLRRGGRFGERVGLGGG